MSQSGRIACSSRFAFPPSLVASPIGSGLENTCHKFTHKNNLNTASRDLFLCCGEPPTIQNYHSKQFLKDDEQDNYVCGRKQVFCESFGCGRNLHASFHIFPFWTSVSRAPCSKHHRKSAIKYHPHSCSSPYQGCWHLPWRDSGHRSQKGIQCQMQINRAICNPASNWVREHGAGRLLYLSQTYTHLSV